MLEATAKGVPPVETQVREKIAYLKGLASGLNVDPESREGRLLHGFIDVLDSLSASVEHWAAEQQDLEDYVAAMDDDLSDVEEFLDLGGEDDLSYFRLDCPECGNVLYVDEEMFEDDDPVEIECPECHHRIAIGAPAKEDPADGETPRTREVPPS